VSRSNPWTNCRLEPFWFLRDQEVPETQSSGMPEPASILTRKRRSLTDWQSGKAPEITRPTIAERNDLRPFPWLAVSRLEACNRAPTLIAAPPVLRDQRTRGWHTPDFLLCPTQLALRTNGYEHMDIGSGSHMSCSPDIQCRITIPWICGTTVAERDRCGHAATPVCQTLPEGRLGLSTIPDSFQ
jgi:hypothetical protein